MRNPAIRKPVALAVFAAVSFRGDINSMPADETASATRPGSPGARTPSSAAGFTLLEVLVATTIMGIAVAGLIAGLSQSVRNASRLADYDRAAMLARTKMNDLLLDPTLPFIGTVSGEFEQEQSGGVESGWQATLRPFEARPNAGPGSIVLQEVALEIWWRPASSVKGPDTRRTMKLAGYRSATIPTPPRP